MAVLRGGSGRRCVVLMNQSSRDDTLQGVRPSPGPGRGAVSSQSSRDKRRKRSLPGTAVRREGRAISSHVAWDDIRVEHVARAGGEDAVEAGKREMLAEVSATASRRSAAPAA